jgi:hypothetical protein
MTNESSTTSSPFQTQDGIFIHHVPEKEMQSSLTGRRQLDVPRGHVAVVVYKDKGKQTVEILPSGVQVAVGLIERFANLFTGSVERKSFYVVSRQPISVISAPVQFQDGAGRSVGVRALVSVSAPVGDPDRLVNLIEALLAQNVFIEASQVRSQLAPVVDQAIRGALVKGADGTLDVTASSTNLKKALDAQLGRIGFAIDVSLSSGEARLEVEVRLGEAPTPALKMCVRPGCGNMIQQTKRFCGVCREPQPVATNPSTACFDCGHTVAPGKRFCGNCRAEQKPSSIINEALYTSDGEQLRVYLSLLVEGYQGRADDGRIQNAVQAALRSQLQRVTAAQIANRQGLAAFQESVKLDIEAAVASVGARLVGVGALDVRQTNGEWILQARAELERAKKESQLDREWLARDREDLEVSGLQLDLKSLQYEMAMRRVAIENDQAVALRRAELDKEFKQEQLALQHGQRTQQMRLENEFVQTGTQLDHDTRMQSRQLDAEFAQTGTQLDHDVRMQGRQLDAEFTADGQRLTDEQRRALRDVEQRETREGVRDRDATQDIRDADRTARTGLAIDKIEGDARDEQLDRDASREVRGAQRDSTTTLAVDAAERVRDRQLRAENKVDTLQDIVDTRDVSRQQRAAERETTTADREDQLSGMQHDHDVATRQQQNDQQLAEARLDNDLRRDEKVADHTRRMDDAKLDSELKREEKVAGHDLKLKAEVSRARRGQAEDDSYLARLQAEDTSHQSRLQADDALYAQRNQQEFSEQVADRALDRKHRDADLMVNREQAVADRELERELSAEDRRSRSTLEQVRELQNIAQQKLILEEKLASEQREQATRLKIAEENAANAAKLEAERLAKDHDLAKARLASEEKQKLAEALKDASGVNALTLMASSMEADKVAALADVLKADSQGKSVDKERERWEEENRRREDEVRRRDDEARRREDMIREENRRREDDARARQDAMMANFLAIQQSAMSANQNFAISMTQQQTQLAQTAIAGQQATQSRDLANAQEAAHRERATAKEAADRERDALRGASQQAVSMSQHSMGAMSQVATQAATHGPTVVMPMAGGGGGAGRATAPSVVPVQESTARPAPPPPRAPESKSGGIKCRGTLDDGVPCTAVVTGNCCEDCGWEP